MKTILSCLGALFIAFIGIMGTTSPGDATSHVGGWFEWLGISQFPAFLGWAATDRIFQLIAAVAITVLVCRWWYRFSAKRQIESDNGWSMPTDYGLSERMESMADRMRHVLSREWWDDADPNADVLADFDALGITLIKAGFDLPQLPSDTKPDVGLNFYIGYLTQVGSLLRNGHGKEARARAVYLSAPYPKAVIQ